MADTPENSWQQTSPWAPQASHLQNVFGEAERTYGAQKAQPSPNWQMYPDVSRQTQEGLQQRETTLEQASMPFLGNLVNTQDAWLTAPNVAQNPIVNNMVDMANRRIGENYQQYVQPQLGFNALADNAFGDTRHGVAEGLAAGAANRQMGDVTSQIYSDAYQTGLDAYMKGMALSPDIVNALGGLGTEMMDIGRTQEEIDYMPTAEQWARWEYEMNKPWDILSNYQGAIQGMYGSEGGTEYGDFDRQGNPIRKTSTASPASGEDEYRHLTADQAMQQKYL